MTIDRLRELLCAEPFQKFTMHLADGRAIEVHHPEFLAASPSGLTCVVFQPDDRLNIIDLLLVTDLEVQPNGRPRRKKRKTK